MQSRSVVTVRTTEALVSMENTHTHTHTHTHTPAKVLRHGDGQLHVQHNVVPAARNKDGLAGLLSHTGCEPTLFVLAHKGKQSTSGRQ